MTVEDRFDREVSRVEQRVIIDLPVVMVERLLEIAFAVENAHADKAKSQVAGGFSMIAGQNAEASRGYGQCFVKAKFGSEIGDRILQK